MSETEITPRAALGRSREDVAAEHLQHHPGHRDDERFDLSLIGRIYAANDRHGQFDLIEQLLPLSCRGAEAQFYLSIYNVSVVSKIGVVEVAGTQSQYRWLREWLLRNSGAVVQSYTGSIPSDGGNIAFIPKNALPDDFVPPKYSESDPTEGNRLTCGQGLTNEAVIDRLTAPGLESDTAYFGERRRLAIRETLMRELRDELSEQALGCGVIGVSHVWVRRQSGEILRVTGLA